MYVLSYSVYDICSEVYYQVATVDDLSSDEETLSSDSETEEAAEGTETSEETDSGITVEDVYNVSVSQNYMLLVIAFGVFLICGVLIAKTFWERFK